MTETIRRVRIEAPFQGEPSFILELRDTGRTDKRRQTILAYSFGPEGETPLFEADDFSGSPLHADDSDATLRALLGFLTLRPGDTDREYFEGYTAEQHAWSQSTACEYLQCMVEDLEFQDF